MKNILALAAQIDISTISFDLKKVAEGDTILGKLSDNLIRFYGYIIQETLRIHEKSAAIVAEYNALSAEIITARYSENMASHDPVKCKQMCNTANELHEKFEVLEKEKECLRGAFWALVDIEFEQCGKNDYLALRESWQIVIPARKPATDHETEIGNILSELWGHDIPIFTYEDKNPPRDTRSRLERFMDKFMGH